MPLDWITKELSAIREADLWRSHRVAQSSPTPRMRFNGNKVLQFASNAYLGLQTHPEVIAAAQQAPRNWGAGAGAARLITGTNELHAELERSIARLKGTDDAILFSSGYLANLGAIPALAGEGDLIVADALNHASLIDGARLSRATIRVVPHADADAFTRVLETERSRFRRCLILTDGVFGVDGDLPPMVELSKLAQNHDAVLYVDDAHGTGVLGEGGSGTASHLGASGIDIHMGTLSKAFASQGGFIAGSKDLCDLLRHRARSYFFSTAPAASTIAAAQTAMNVAANDPSLRARVRSNQQRLRTGLRAQGWNVPEGETPIIPIMVGTPQRALSLMAALESQGILVPAIRPPTVPAGTCRLRLSVTAAHDERDLEELLAATAKLAPLKVA